ncbi:MAG: hypothetical protein QOF30_542 [Acidimicrobiaceae bacterium]|jgi:hypothetical protein|nr:hypothetical protein [Acidimicrobiaceae bacterium]
MSWDVFAFVAPKDLRRMEELPTGYQMPAMGSRDELIGTIRQLAPQVDESDPEWLVVQGPDYLVEVSLGSELSVDSFMFFVRGDAPSGVRVESGAVRLMLAIADSVGATLFDTSRGTFLTAS